MSELSVAFVEVSRKIHARDSLQMHGECKVSQTPFLALGADPSPCLFVCSLSSTLSVVLCVSVMKCVIPLVGNEKKTLNESLVMNSFV